MLILEHTYLDDKALACPHGQAGHVVARLDGLVDRDRRLHNLADIRQFGHDGGHGCVILDPPVGH